MVITAKYLLKDDTLANDAAQEAFVALWRNRSNIDTSKSIRAYLKTATINRSINLQKSIRHHRGVGPDALDYRDSQYADPHQTSEQKELSDLIQMSVDQLPLRCREVFILAKYEGMSYKDIAAHLGITPKTVENQMNRALKSLRVKLAPYLNKTDAFIFLISLWVQINF